MGPPATLVDAATAKTIRLASQSFHRGTSVDPHVSKNVREHILRPYNAGDFSAEPWRSLPEIPSSEEIMGTHDYRVLGDDEDSLDGEVSEKTRLDLPDNLVDRPWKDAASYIGAHYRLLREDSLYPLRKSVADVKAVPTMKDSGSTAIYTHVHIVGITLSTQGPAVKVEFSYESAGKRIRWEQSERLQQGTIVALTPRNDMFNTICKVAVVAARPIKNGVELNPPRVDLFWADWDDAEFDPNTNWVMIESRSGYWESFRHLGVALQKLRSESFPLSKYLANLQKTVDAPDHIKRNPLTNMTSLVSKTPGNMYDDAGEYPELENVNALETWPEMSSNLDKSQLEATKRILTKQIAIIQGPPGTGKTFVSITSLKVMLENMAPGDPPIILAAQTNHALDQLLLLIAQYAPDFIRLGGRTSDGTGAIKKRTIYEVRHSLVGETLRQFGQVLGSRNVHQALENSSNSLLGHLAPLVTDEALNGLRLLDLGLITQEQFDSLNDPNWITVPSSDPEFPKTDICNWVGIEQMCRLQSKCPSINVSFEEEELDEQYEKLTDAEAELGPKFKSDDEIEALNGEYWDIKQSWTGGRARGWGPARIKKLLASTSDLWDIPDEIRGEFYSYFLAQSNKEIRRHIRQDCKSYMSCVANKKINKWEADANMITGLNIKVIGCTTTGLSKYRGLIAALKPRTLLIEEAAETVEGTVLAAMFESLDHLILVGDHQQLQAKCNHPALSNMPYNLSISMFERLVNNNFEFTMLNQQRRMVPEIRQNFTHVYPKLTDHPSVKDRVVNRPPVPGMATTCRWFSHIWPESKMDTSRCNLDEAEMVVRFFDYLVLNGTDPSKITILTFYNGQKKILLKMLKNHLNLKEIEYFNVFTVDSYQGEENDIILLSLVRSNDYQESGFLSNRNRAVVSLSRARRGLYVFGNVLHLLAREGDRTWRVWAQISNVFHEKATLSDTLPLTCQKHKATVHVKEPHDWDLMRITGGCRMTCKGALPCGHACPHNCHPFEHDRIICKVACDNILDCGHECSKNCGDNCECPVCPPIPANEYLRDFADPDLTEWQAPPNFKKSIKHSIIQKPYTHPRLPDPSDSNNFLPQNRALGALGNGAGNISSTLEEWTASAKSPEKLAQFPRIGANPTTSSAQGVAPQPRARTPGITDNFRQVTVGAEGRSAPGKSIKKEIPGHRRTPTSGQSVIQQSPVISPAPKVAGKSLRTSSGALVLSRPVTPPGLENTVSSSSSSSCLSDLMRQSAPIHPLSLLDDDSKYCGPALLPVPLQPVFSTVDGVSQAFAADVYPQAETSDAIGYEEDLLSFD